MFVIKSRITTNNTKFHRAGQKKITHRKDSTRNHWKFRTNVFRKPNNYLGDRGIAKLKIRSKLDLQRDLHCCCQSVGRGALRME